MRARCLSGLMLAVSLNYLLLTFTTDAYGMDPAAAAQNATEAEPAKPAAAGDFVEPAPGHHDHQPRAGWYLGVYGNYTDTGLALTEVFPDTAAAKAGLEVGDRIVAVGGQQIGLLVRARLDLDVALQLHARRNGWVRLLIQDRRTLRLFNLEVPLTRGRVHT